MFDRIAHLFPEVQVENERHREVQFGINERLAKIQQECPHENTRYHSCPNGRDSHTTCEDCGAQKERGEDWSCRVDGVLGWERS